MTNPWRADFPMLKTTLRGHPLIYLDSAATSLKPDCVAEATAKYYNEQYGTVHRAVYALAQEATERYDLARGKVAKLIHAASPNEVVFTKGTTEAINLVASCMAQAFLQLGDEVLVAETEHHSNIVPWQLACARRGATLRVIPVNDQGELILEELEGLLSPRTQIVAVAHVSNSLGVVHPVKKIVEMAHRVRAKVLIDGAQAVAHMPVDVQEIGADFYAFSGHKLYGPTGIGVLYGKEDLLNELPPYQGGGDMIDTVTFDETTYAMAPTRFEAGTPNIAGALGLGSAIDYLQSIGMHRIQQTVTELHTYALSAIQSIEGVHVHGRGDHHGPILSFTVEGIHPLDIGTLLDLRGIAVRTGHLCAQPTMNRFGVTSMIRASFGLYNTQEEVDRFIDELGRAIEKLR